MNELLLIHRANIKRPAHTLVGQKKATDWQALSTAVECFLTPAGDTRQGTLLGLTASEAWRGWFRPGANVRIGDLVIWTDRTPNLEFLVDGVEERQGGLSHVEDHIELSLKRRAA